MDIPPPPESPSSPEGAPSHADAPPPEAAASPVDFSKPQDAHPPRDAWPSGAIPTQADGTSYTGAAPASPPPFDAAQTAGSATPPPAAGGPVGPPPVPPAPQGAQPSYPQAPYGTPPPYGAQPPYGPQPYGPQPYGAGGPYPVGGPYGPAGGPYGYPGAGWYPVEQSTNGLAIASLVVSLAAGCVPFLGLIFGIFGLRQIRRNGQRGRGLAIAGIIINSVGTVLLALFITLGVIGAMNEGNTQVEDLKAGDCFNTVGHSLSDYGDQGTRSTSVDVVSCGDKHDAEAYAVFPVDLGEDYPGVESISSMADDKCSSYADDYLGDASLSDDMEIYYYLPPREGWDHGDRSVTCFFGSRGGKVSGSVKSAGGTSGVGV